MASRFTRVFAEMLPAIRRAELRLDYAHPLYGRPMCLQRGEDALPLWFHQAEAPDAPILFEMHGGGFALGGASKTDALRQRICRAGITVVGVDYRKAPEHPHPAALEDVCMVISWFRERQETLGLAAARFFAMGESGGGTLAAAAALAMPGALDGQILHYPLLDMAKPYDQREHFPTDFPPEMSQAFNEMYRPDGAFDDPMVSPLRAPAAMLEKAPPALILAAGQDMLRTDGAVYAERLQMAGVPVEYREFAGAHHGYVEDWFNPERYGAMTDAAAQAQHLDSFGRYAEKAADKTIAFILSMP